MKKIFLLLMALMFTSVTYANPANVDFDCDGSSDIGHACLTLGDSQSDGFTCYQAATAKICRATCTVSAFDPATGFCSTVRQEGFDVGNCTGADCGKLPPKTATFDFDIHSGGFKDMLFPCEVKFTGHLCTTSACASGQDYMVLNFTAPNTVEPTFSDLVAPIILRPGQTYSTLDPSHAPSGASVYLNSTNYGEGWSVKYCYDVTRAIVGDVTNLGKLSLVFDADLKVVTGSYNGTTTDNYFTESGLEYVWVHSCTPTTFVDDASDGNASTVDGTWDHVFYNTTDTDSTVGNSICLGVDCVPQVCSWTVKFQETNECIRKIRVCDATGNCDPNDANSTYAATVHTEVNTKNGVFSCTGAGCP